jgi:hypothetical protein
MTGKYTPLEKYLSDLPESTREITLNFGQIEIILNDTLPPSAYCHQAWWANNVRGSHVEAHAWLNAGWKVESFDQKKAWVRFHREHD